MKKSSILCCWVLALAVSACGTVTKVPTAWKDPAYTGEGFSRVFVIGIGENDGARRMFEDHLAQELVKRGVVAEASYSRLPNTDRLTEGAIQEAMDGGSFDAVTISHLIGETKETKYVPPRTYTVPRTYGGYYGYYYSHWDTVHEPGYYKTNTIVRLETNLYGAQNAALVWSGQSDTMNPNSVADTIASATQAIAKQIAKDGVLR
jgi:hypothetical protein